MARLQLADGIDLTFGREGLSFEGDVRPDESFFKDNLAVKAVKASEEFTGPLGPVHVHIRKNIPLGAGLGGGSSDAAAVLNYFGTKAAVPRERLCQTALSLGSDVPFFLGPKTALAEGRGEILTEDRRALPPWVLLVKPSIMVSTGRIFRELALTKAAGSNNLGSNFRPGAECSLGENDLSAAAAGLFPELKETAQLAAGLGGLAAGMTGSGPTFWILFEQEQKALSAQDSLRDSSLWTCLTGWADS
jgi:4-diphosphocytidyl-2-C-methyl-D-erythritol kinase